LNQFRNQTRFNVMGYMACVVNTLKHEPSHSIQLA